MDELFGSSSQKKTIFLIDEDIELLKKLGGLLVEHCANFEVFATDNLEDASDHLKDHKAQIIIIDHHYFDFISELREKKATVKTPIILMAPREELEKKASEIRKHGVLQVPKAIRVPFFLSTVDSALREASSIESELVELKRGEHLFKTGDESDFIYILKTGHLLVYRFDGGKEYKLSEIDTVQMIGEMGFFDQRPRSASIRALEDSVLLKLKLGDVNTFTENQPFWLSMMIKSLITRLRDTNRKLIQQSDSSS